MILIADSGATKTEWVLTHGTTIIARVKTDGFNAATAPQTQLQQIVLDRLLPQLPPDADIQRINFYGAGCAGSNAASTEKLLRSLFNGAEVEVYSDIMAASQALCGDQPGIACILGTGSNSCFYDGRNIVAQVPSLGFILGDEGSGAALGRRLIADIYKRRLPATIADKFHRQYELELHEIIERVYRQPAPNRFLASFAPFLLQNIEMPEIHALVLDCFKSFFTRNLVHYTQYGHNTVNIVGSIGWHFSRVIEEAATHTGFKLGTVLQSPLPSLIDYCIK